MTSPSFTSLRENLSRKYSCETFIHTWDTLESTTPTWYKQSGKTESTDPEEIERIYSPTKLVVEKQSECSNEIILHNQSRDGLLYSEYSKFRANELKKEFGKFDYSLLVRPDVHFYNTDLPEIENEYLSLGSVRHNNAAADIIQYSTSEMMDKVRNYNLVYRNYLESFKFINNEGYFLKYLNESGLNVRFADYYMPRDWKIVRSWWPSVDYYESDRKTWDHNYDR